MQRNINTFLKTFFSRPLFSLKCALDRNGCEQIPTEKSNNICLFLNFFSFVETKYYTIYCQCHYGLDLLLVVLIIKKYVTK